MKQIQAIQLKSGFTEPEPKRKKNAVKVSDHLNRITFNLITLFQVQGNYVPFYGFKQQHTRQHPTF